MQAGLRRQQAQGGEPLQLVRLQSQGPHGFPSVHAGVHSLQQGLQRQNLAVSGLRFLVRLPQGPLYGLQIRQAEFRVDRLDVRHRVHLAADMDDVVVFKATGHLGNGVGLPNVAQEAVA